MTPDPNIMKAPTIAALMNVLRAPPYELPVPKASNFPIGSELRELWKVTITVTANDESYEYVATSTVPWTIMPDIVVKSPMVTIAAGSAATTPIGRRARPARRHRPSKPRIPRW